jgi:hypothetical protein
MYPVRRLHRRCAANKLSFLQSLSTSKSSWSFFINLIGLRIMWLLFHAIPGRCSPVAIGERNVKILRRYPRAYSGVTPAIRKPEIAKHFTIGNRNLNME